MKQLTSAGASVRVLRTLQELEHIRHEWESWPGSRDSEMESYLTFLRSNPSTVRPHIVVVERNGDPAAILVGRIDRSHINCRLGYLNFNLPATIISCVYGALRGNPSSENCALIVDSIIDSLASGEADAAQMNFLKEDSDLCRLAKGRPGRLSRDYVKVIQSHFAAVLPSTTDEFYRGLSSGFRWQARSKQKKLVKTFGNEVRVRCFRGITELDEMIRDVERIASKSYQRGIGVGFVDTPITRRHLELKAERGRLRGFVLYLHGQPSAFWIGEVNRGTFESDSLAYDATFGKYSPGIFLILKVIEGFCEDASAGVSKIDFAVGHAQYKEVLSNQNWTETSVYVFALSLKGVTYNMVRTLIVGVDQSIKKALIGTGVLQKVKRAWRNYLRPGNAAPAGA